MRHVILFRDPGENQEEAIRSRLHSSLSTTSDEGAHPERGRITSEKLSTPESFTHHPPSHPKEPTLVDPFPTDPYELLLSAAGISCSSIPVLKYEFINSSTLAEELTRYEEFQGVYSFSCPMF